MPEGPTIRRIADCLHDKLHGKPVLEVSFGVKALERHQPELSGRVIERVRSFGKAIVFDLEGGRSIFTHTQLYGRWFVVEAGKKPPGNKKLGVSFNMGELTAILTSTTKIEVLDTAALGRHSFLGKLGPDTLDPDVTEADVTRQLERFGDQPIGQILLDQSFMAGIGNYLRTEILFLSKLRPEHRFNDLDLGRKHAFVQQVLATPRRSYQAQGFTTSDEHIQRGEARGIPRASLKRYVYDHAGEPCPVCSSTIAEEQFDGRRVFICPSCQS